MADPVRVPARSLFNFFTVLFITIYYNFTCSATSHNKLTALPVQQKYIDECTFTAVKHTQAENNFKANTQNTETEEQRGITLAWYLISGFIFGQQNC